MAEVEAKSYAVVGSRNFSDYALLCETLSSYAIEKVVSGGAQGADKLAERYVEEYNAKKGERKWIELVVYRPEWEKYGRAAGIIRNKDIIGNCDVVIAFWDGKSKRTSNAIQIAKKMQKKVIPISY